MLIEDKRPWPRPCHRCGKWVDNEHSHVGHGFTRFCDSCEDSYNEWFKSGETRELREMVDNNKKAFEILMEWIKYDPKPKRDSNDLCHNPHCHRCEKWGDYDVWNIPVCKDHKEEFEKLKKDLGYIEF